MLSEKSHVKRERTLQGEDFLKPIHLKDLYEQSYIVIKSYYSPIHQD